VTNLVICYPDVTAWEAGAFNSNDQGDQVERVRAGELSREYAKNARTTDDFVFNYSGPVAKPVNHFGILNAKTLQDGGCTSAVLRSASVSAFAPTEIAGLQLWLDAGRGVTKDGSSLVSQWSDLSGQGNDCSASGAERPTWVAPVSQRQYNPSLWFNGAQRMACDSLAAVISGDDKPFTAFCAIRLQQVLGVVQLWLGFGRASSATPFVRLYAADSAILQKAAQKRDDASSLTTRTAGTPSLTHEVSGYVCDGTNITHYNNGSLISGPSSFNVGVTTLDTCNIGSRSENGVENFELRGTISEIVFYNSALSGADLTKIQDYLVARHVTAPKYQTITLDTDTLTGRKGKHLFEALASSSATNWWLTLGTESTSRYRHSKHLIGSYLDLGRDPVWGRRAEVVGDYFQDKRRKYRYSLTWEGLTTANVADFETNIAEKADSTVFALAAVDGYDPVLLEDEIVPCYLESYEVAPLAHNTYQLNTEWIEAL
jgi:hypothetical protein